MKIKTIIPLVASMLLLAACNNSEGSTSTQPSTTTTSTSTIPTRIVKLTSIEPGKIYIDINFATLPEGFAIKYADQTITSTTTITVPKDTTFTVEGALNNICLYRIQENDSDGTSAVGLGEHIDEEAAKDIAKKYLDLVAKNSEGFRSYICITDTVDGYSKSVPGVSDIITSYKNRYLS